MNRSSNGFPYAFKGLPIINGGGRRRSITGTALIRPVNPDWEGEETFAVVRVKVMQEGAADPVEDDHLIAPVEIALHKAPKLKAEIEEKLRAANAAEGRK